MNPAKLLNFTHSLYLVTGNANNPMTITCDRVQQRNGSFLWKVMKGGSSLSKEGYFGHEPLPSSRDEDYLSEHRFETLTEACRAFNAFLTTQSDPSHAFYIQGYQWDLEPWKREFNLFLKELEITL